MQVLITDFIGFNFIGFTFPIDAEEEIKGSQSCAKERGFSAREIGIERRLFVLLNEKSGRRVCQEDPRGELGRRSEKPRDSEQEEGRASPVDARRREIAIDRGSTG